MIVHRILDVVFRTLDTVDAVRARVGTLLGKEPHAASEWPPVVEDHRPPPGRGTSVADIKNTYTEAPDLDGYTAGGHSDGGDAGDAGQAGAPKKARKKAAKAKAAKASTRPRPVKKKASSSASSSGGSPASSSSGSSSAPAPREPKEKKGGSHRKGSVDRKGVDFDSPRARAVEAWLKDTSHPVVSEDAALDGKKTLARVLWAVGAADSAGSEHGLTAADASALLSSSAQLDVFATNVARAFRDEGDLFQETVPDGRSKRYKLTAAGRARLGEVSTTMPTTG